MTENLIALVVGFLFASILPIAVRRVNVWRATKRVPAPSYDIRIDAITDKAIERYKLNKALTSMEARQALVGTDLYAKAASVLGWNV